MAFAAFADAPVDVAVVEVGLGGRWDATNVVNAPVAVITPIGVDHADYLGDTIAEIRRREGRHHHQAGGRPRAVGHRSQHRRGHRQPGAGGDGSAFWRRRFARTPRWRARIPSSRCLDGRSPSVGSCWNCKASAACTPTSSCRCTASIRRTTRWSRWPRSRRSSAGGRTATARHRCGPGGLRRRHQPRPAGTDAHCADGVHRRGPQSGRRHRTRAGTTGGVRLPVPLVGVVSVMADKDVDGILAALEPAFDQNRGDPQRITARARR